KVAVLTQANEYKPVALQSNFTKAAYCEAVQTVKNYILEGDIFEANISQRFKADFAENNAYDLYRRFRVVNPAPFSAYVQWQDMTIVSASPERFLKLSQGNVEARPIKGTRPRGKTESEDQFLANELIESEKDHAENVMIVDLLRND